MPSSSSTNNRFGPLVSASEVTALQKSTVPANTKKNTNWAANVWSKWAANRTLQCPTEWPPHLMIIKPCELNSWLSCFVMEVGRRDGKAYPPNTLHQLCCGILRYVRETKPNLDIFKDPEFASFRRTLDAEMKRLKGTPGIRSVPKQAEPISAAEEEILWSKGLLGNHSPQCLVETMVFMAGMYFALRSGEEHRQLRMSSIELIEKPGAVPYLVYTKSASKNNPGGLKHRKVTTKQVTHFANTECPLRCFVQLYKQYCSHRPDNVKDDAFYLSPMPNAKGNIWYKRQAIGIHTLAGTVKRLCELGGIAGYKTNHSLRVTAATRLFRSGMDEQLIMERTGHRSTDGVRAYKRSSLEQQALVSHVVNRESSTTTTCTSNNPSVKDSVDPKALLLGSEEEKENLPQGDLPVCTNLPQSASANLPQSASANQPQSASTNQPQPTSSVPPLSFSGCSGITINWNFKN